MNEDLKERVWDVFEDCLPNLCYIGRTRSLLSGLLQSSSTLTELISKLEDEVRRIENPSLRTDVRILVGKLSLRMRNEGRQVCFQ